MERQGLRKKKVSWLVVHRVSPSLANWLKSDAFVKDEPDLQSNACRDVLMITLSPLQLINAGHEN